MEKDINYYMNEAVKEAKKAFEDNEVPIGCIIVYKDEVIAKSFNKRNTKKNTLYHAEIIAIDEACKFLGDWRLEGCTMYVTVEPCPMCAGAVLQSRIDRLVFGTYNKKAGCCGSIYNLLDDDRFNHKVKVESGVMEDECTRLMKDFFKKTRDKNSIECKVLDSYSDYQKKE
ncbi:MAG: tRNA adenosine(34) deaminase TadA [Lachnospirales bacterium]